MRLPVDSKTRINSNLIEPKNKFITKSFNLLFVIVESIVTLDFFMETYIKFGHVHFLDLLWLLQTKRDN